MQSSSLRTRIPVTARAGLDLTLLGRQRGQLSLVAAVTLSFAGRVRPRACFPFIPLGECVVYLIPQESMLVLSRGA